MDGILNHSMLPARLATWVGLAVSLAAVARAVIYLGGKLVYGRTSPASWSRA